MSNKIATYNRNLQTLITVYKPRIEILMENYDDPIGNFIIEIQKLIKAINSKTRRWFI